ncbi:MAG: DUF2778 domain-containing protein [Pseudolabrys sp.]|jgi:hypothetical protein
MTPSYGDVLSVIANRRSNEAAALLDGAAAVRDVNLGHASAFRAGIVAILAVLAAAAIAALITIAPVWVRAAYTQADTKGANEKSALQNTESTPQLPDVESLPTPGRTSNDDHLREFTFDPGSAPAVSPFESSPARGEEQLFPVEPVGADAPQQNEATTFIRDSKHPSTDVASKFVIGTSMSAQAPSVNRKLEIPLPRSRPQIDHYDGAGALSSNTSIVPGSTQGPSFGPFAWLKRLLRFKDAQTIPIFPPEAGGRTAVYDIEGHAVYLPNGEKLEAHSGLGELLDDARYVNLKDRGPTPPNIYRLTLREQLFHGVQAIRLNPVGGGNMYGRAGMLVHPYMLGPNGQSNGCVSLQDYPKFLQAFLSGEINRLIVVGHLENVPFRAAYAQAQLTARNIVAH